MINICKSDVFPNVSCNVDLLLAKIMSILSAKHVITINLFRLIFGQAGTPAACNFAASWSFFFTALSVSLLNLITYIAYSRLYVQTINTNILSVTACIFGNTQLV